MSDITLREINMIEKNLETRLQFSARVVGEEAPVQLQSELFSRKCIKKTGGGKITSLDWSPDGKRIVSISQGGSILVYDAMTKYMQHFIEHKQKLLDCAFGPDNDSIAVGGLDNIVSIYRLSENKKGGDGQKQTLEFKDCEGYVGAIEWLSKDQLVCGSGDKICRIFDTNRGECIQSYQGHQGDVSSIALHPTNSDLWVTSSIKDGTCKLWDKRSKYGSMVTFPAGRFPCEADLDIPAVTSLAYMRNGHAFGAGTDSGEVKIFDTRMCYKQLINICTYDQHEDAWPTFEADQEDHYQDFKKERIELRGVETLEFSASGRVVFTGHGDGVLRGFDVLANSRTTANAVWEQPSLEQELENPACVSALRLSPDGKALAAGWRSHNVMLQIFA